MNSRRPIVAIDYGHGGIIDGEYQTPGAKQYTFTDHGGHWIGEGITNRKIAAHAIRYLIEADVVLVDCVAGVCWDRAPDWVELEQRDIPLAERVRVANEADPDLFVSMHSNAIGDGLRGPSRAPAGVSFFTSPGQTVADDFASLFYECFQDGPQELQMRRGHWGDGDVDWEAGFYVLRKTRCPAVLGEVGFFTNISDARYLQSERGQRAIGWCYAWAVLWAVGGHDRALQHKQSQPKH